MSIRFACTGCGAQLKVADEKAGSSGKCPRCGAAIVIPAAAQPAHPAELPIPAAPPPVPLSPQSADEFPSFEAIDTDLPRRRERPATTSGTAAPADYRSAKTLTTVTSVMLGTLLVLHFAFWVIAIVQFIELQDIAPYLPVDVMPLMGSDMAALGVLVVYIPTYVACVVSFCMWTYRVNRNAAALSGRPLDISPGWSVGWYFVPIMNLFRPCQAMKEIWQASNVRRTSTNLVTVWWTLWIVAAFGGRLSQRLSLKAETAGDLRGCTFLDIALGLINVPLCIAAILVVRRLFAMQQAKAAQSGPATPD